MAGPVSTRDDFAEQRVTPADHDGQVIVPARVQLVGQCQPVGLAAGLAVDAVEDRGR